MKCKRDAGPFSAMKVCRSSTLAAYSPNDLHQEDSADYCMLPER